MRILIIHTAYKLQGGEDTVVSNEMELLRVNGHTVDLLQFSNESETLKKLLQLPFNYSSYIQVCKKISAFKPQVIHIHNLHFSGSPSVLYAIKKNKIPIVATLHNYRLLCPSATLFNNRSLYMSSINQVFPYNAIVKGVYQNSRLITFWVGFSMALHHLLGTWKLVDRFIILGAHSETLFRKSKLNWLSNRLIVKPNFCYDSVRPRPATEAGRYYLYVGRLSAEKGIDTLLKAFAINKLPLKIVGTGPLKNEVENYSRRYPNIKYMGSQNKEQVQDLMLDATALLFPSLWYETFGMVVIEAFAAGKPVITSRLGQMENLITDGFNGLHFEAGNPVDLNLKIMYFESLSNPDKLQYCSNAKKTYEEKYTPQKNLEQLVSIYNTLAYQEQKPVVSP